MNCLPRHLTTVALLLGFATSAAGQGTVPLTRQDQKTVPVISYPPRGRELPRRGDHLAGCRGYGSESILIGHSMGAATTLIEAGARNRLGVNGTDAFSAYIALSPQGAGSIFPQHAWAEIARPVLSLTGTRDTELGGASWETRTEPYRDMPAGCKWLGVIDGATHMNFAGNGVSHNVETLTTQAIGAFHEALHRGDCRAPAQIRGMNIQSK